MHIKRCNGCMAELVDHWIKRGDERVVIQGTRVDGLVGGYPLPNTGDEFHWCMNCSKIAFKAVEESRS